MREWSHGAGTVLRTVPRAAAIARASLRTDVAWSDVRRVPLLTPPLAERLRATSSSARLRAAMDAGASPHPAAVEALLDRCAVEPDFFVRDMLTWALLRQPAQRTVPRLVEELESPFPQARSQALHTLSKIGDGGAYPAIFGALLHDEEDEVARAAWRAAVILVPPDGAPALAVDLGLELGRRTRECRLSLTRALLDLGEAARAPLEHAVSTGAFSDRAHAAATLAMLDDPGLEFAAALEEAERRALE